MWLKLIGPILGFFKEALAYFRQDQLIQTAKSAARAEDAQANAEALEDVAKVRPGVDPNAARERLRRSGESDPG